MLDRFRRAAAALCAALVVPFASAALAQPPGASPASSARVIVKYRPEASVLKAQPLDARAQGSVRMKALGQRHGLALRSGAAVSERSEVVFADGIGSQELAQRLAADPDVEYAVPDYRRKRVGAPNDPLYGAGVGGNGPAVGQWYLRAPSGPVQSSIDIETAWTVTMGSPSVVVAVLDTGVRFEHPDLLSVGAGGNLLPGYDMISDATTANDGDARDADASDPGDWVTQAEADDKTSELYQCAVEGSSWHGTQVSGYIAALTNNGIGMAGVGGRLRVLPVRVLGKCGGFDSDIISGMRWAAGIAVPGLPVNPYPAQVINMSLGGDGPCDAAYLQVVNELNARGVTIVAAAGNSAGHAVIAPANCPGVIGVGGLRHIGTKVGFSDLGPEIAISAPAGNCVNTTAGSPCLYPLLTTSNAGANAPGASIWTDSFDSSLGTSFSTPLVAGTAALMLSVQPSLSPFQVKQVLQATARPFPAFGADPGTPACVAPQLDANGTPVDQLECYCKTSVCGAGMLDAGAAVLAASAGLPDGSVQAQGLWWNAPAGSESGWGINFAHQGDVIFATWFTYDTSGKAWWLSMTATRTGPNAYSGTLYQTNGPAFNAVPFNGSAVAHTAVGSASVTFTSANNAVFSYTVNGVAQTKNITREVFGPLPTCTFALHPNVVVATNYEDLWWAAPAGSESGWGINLTEEGNVIFGTWFTYDLDGSPLWLTVSANNMGGATWSGTLYRTTGPAFNAVPFNPSDVSKTAVGTATFTFTDGTNGTFSYTVDGISQSKAITRQVFRAPGTVCVG